MRELTDRQREVLNFIAQFTEENVYPPTVREIAEHFQITLRAVQDHVAALQKKGALSSTQNKSRSLRVLTDMRNKGKARFTASIPVVKSLLAGKRLFTASNVQQYITLSEPFVSSGNSYFCMIIQDQSLTGAGIYPGDCLLFVQTSEVADGEIVAAVIEGGIGSLIRRYFKEESRICLKGDNAKFKTVYSQDVRVAGKLQAVLRTISAKK